MTKGVSPATFAIGKVACILESKSWLMEHCLEQEWAEHPFQSRLEASKHHGWGSMSPKRKKYWEEGHVGWLTSSQCIPYVSNTPSLHLHLDDKGHNLNPWAVF